MLTKKLIIFLTFFHLSSCTSFTTSVEDLKSNFWIKKYPDTNVESEIEQDSSGIIENVFTEPEQISIELMWLVPEGRTTKYIIRYGTNPKQLVYTKEISVRELVPVMHPKIGKVYKYILNGVPKSKIYYTLQAGNEFGLSDPTPVASEEP